MHRYVNLALIGFVTCSPLSFLLWQAGARDVSIQCLGIYLAISGAYLPSCSAYLSDLFVRQDANKSIATQLKILLVGASWGLFLLVWTAFLEAPFSHPAGIYLSGIGTKEVQEKAWQLYPKAELLFWSLKIVDNWIRYSCFFAALTLISFWLYTKANSRNSWTQLCLPLLVPSLTTMRILYFVILACRDIIPSFGLFGS